ncbi:UNVERIFIED_CONTAM: hypothetical protein GTU68_008020 [Idotea baltica]|nr:hypothetical protein [Idotea baltica]
MIIISLVFIPNPWCSLHVGFAIVSIELGVIGYMSLWGVNLDPISMVTLIMCIGFSVDFSAHISYSYLTSKKGTADEKMIECLFCLGLPIIQGGLSTIVSVITFVFVPSYAYVAFFKVIFLVVTFACMHGLFIIPVLLSVADPSSLNRFSKKKNLYLKNLTTSKYEVSAVHIPVDNTTEEKMSIQLKMDDCSFKDMITHQARADPEGCSNESASFTNDDSSDTTETSKE